jgi:hypothetical protein
MFGALNRLIGRQASRPDARLLALTLNNMTQGVVLFDTGARLIVFNEQYRVMYGLSPDVVKPGAALIDIIRNRISSGSLGRDAEEYCEEIMSQIAAGKTISFINETPDGRAISVVNRPIPGSNYWVGIHDDITERRLVERRNALLDEQEVRRARIEEAIAGFHQSVDGVLKTVADSVTAMQSTASVLAATSRETAAPSKRPAPAPPARAFRSSPPRSRRLPCRLQRRRTISRRRLPPYSRRPAARLARSAAWPARCKKSVNSPPLSRRRSNSRTPRHRKFPEA